MTGVQRGHHVVAAVVATAEEELRATRIRWGIIAGVDTEAEDTEPMGAASTTSVPLPALS